LSYYPTQKMLQLEYNDPGVHLLVLHKNLPLLQVIITTRKEDMILRDLRITLINHIIVLHHRKIHRKILVAIREANLLLKIIETIDLIREIDLIVEMLEVIILGLMVIEIFVIILIKADFRIFYYFLQIFKHTMCYELSKTMSLKNSSTF